jgi:hypothetical protein
LYRRDTAASITLEEKERGLYELAEFRKWFNESIMTTDSETGSDAILLMPNGRAVPKYRDEPNGYVFVLSFLHHNCYRRLKREY